MRVGLASSRFTVQPRHPSTSWPRWTVASATSATRPPRPDTAQMAMREGLALSGTPYDYGFQYVLVVTLFTAAKPCFVTRRSRSMFARLVGEQTLPTEPCR